MRSTIQLRPRTSTFSKCSIFNHITQHKFIAKNTVISTHFIRSLPIVGQTLCRSFADVPKTEIKKPTKSVNTNPLDVNSNLNILQGLILAGEHMNVDNRIQKILQKNTNDNIKIELWNLMLSFYASQRNSAKLAIVLKSFEESKAQPNTGTYVLLLQYFGAAGKMEEIEKYVAKAESATYPLDLYLIFHTAIASSSDFNKMYELTERMKTKKLSPNSDTLMAFIASAIRQNNIAEMEMAIKNFRERGIEPHADAYMAILSTHHAKNNMTRVKQILLEIKKKQLDQNVQVVKLLQKLKLRIPRQEDEDE